METTRREVLGGIASLFAKPDVFSKMTQLFPQGSPLRSIKRDQIIPLFQLCWELKEYAGFDSDRLRAYYAILGRPEPDMVLSGQWSLAIEQISHIDRRAKLLKEFEDKGIRLEWVNELIDRPEVSRDIASMIDILRPSKVFHYAVDGGEVSERTASQAFLEYIDQLKETRMMAPDFFRQSSLSRLAQFMQSRSLAALDDLPALTTPLNASDAAHVRRYAKSSSEVQQFLKAPPENLRDSVDKVRESVAKLNTPSATEAQESIATDSASGTINPRFVDGVFIEPFKVRAEVHPGGNIDAVTEGSFNRPERPVNITLGPRVAKPIATTEALSKH